MKQQEGSSTAIKLSSETSDRNGRHSRQSTHGLAKNGLKGRWPSTDGLFQSSRKVVDGAVGLMAKKDAMNKSSENSKER